MNSKVLYTIVGLVLSSFFQSCNKEQFNELHSESFCAEMTFLADFAEVSTKTSREVSGSVLWSPGEEINVFKGSSVSGKFTSQNEEPAGSVSFAGTLSGVLGDGIETYWAVYPYSSGNICDGNGVILCVPSMQTSDEGTFGDGIFPSVAHTADKTMFFYNICGGFKISLSRSDIKEIILEGNEHESLAGKVYLTGDVGSRPSISIKEGLSRITLKPSNGNYFKEGVYYYFTVLPSELSEGFTMSFKTDEQIGVLKTNSPISIKHSVFCSKDNIDSYVTEWEEYNKNNDLGNSGVYLGILSFNQSLSDCPISLLTTQNRSTYTSFINNLSTANGTLLYYSVDNSINSLQRVDYPDDIETVAIVTFTDGLDQGSLMMNSEYMSDEEYIESLKHRLTTESVSGLPISSYSVGVMGSDVSDQTKFRNNLRSLATDPDNVFELGSISELQSRFEEIANSLSASADYSYNVSLLVPGLSDGTRIRFTFDEVPSALYPQKYIEGTFNLRYHSLDDVIYVGLTTSSGSTVVGSVEDEIFLRFSFSDLKNIDGGELSVDSVSEWYYASDIWQRNTEFDGDANSSVEIHTKSAAIYLILDCSSSLGSDFKTMKSAANQFVQKLYAVELQPKSVSLNKQNLSIAVGDEVKLTASILPITAQLSSSSWTSSNNSVASVTEEGVVTAIAPGKTTITFKTHNGKQAICNVNVYSDVKKEWGPVSPDFSYSGVYFGMLVYNKDVYRYKVCRLDDENKEAIVSFIDNVPLQNGSIMCNATEEALNDISSLVFPSDFSKATLVSFTDGMDQGSVMKNNNYSSTNTYLEYLYERIITQTVQNVPISAYSVGIQGEDVTTQQYSLGKLASSSANVFSLKNQSNLDAKMTEIANSADVSVDVLTYPSYDLTITIPGLSNGYKVRFTFDDVSSASDSELYIEGTFDLRERSLYDISFYGFESSMQSIISGAVDGIFVSFDFTDVVKKDKSILKMNYIKEWTSASGLAWQINSEFNTSNVVATSKTKKTVNQNSALVYLVLDYSTSISDNWDVLKTSIKQFVNSLSSKFVGSISFSADTLYLYPGLSKTISRTIRPSTAVDTDLQWVSSDNSVATVDGSGKITAVNLGECEIIAISRNGCSATCKVIVKEVVDLGLSVKWATYNVGADTPEGSGNYYRWGEVLPYDRYVYYKWGYETSMGMNLSKYNSDSRYGRVVDYKTRLDDSDDIAYVKFGGGWHIPTEQEWKELCENCTWTWVADYNGSGTNGMLVTAKNGRSIFLPASGYKWGDGVMYDYGTKGYYFSKDKYSSEPFEARGVEFAAYVKNAQIDRRSACSIRPVIK